MSLIEVQFRLLVINNLVQIPGNEPPSTESSLAFSRSYLGKYPTIPVELALELIPGSKVKTDTTQDGNFKLHKWFLLPIGSPAPNGNECPVKCREDWFKILRDNAKQVDSFGQGDDINNGCSAYDFGYCNVDDFSDSLNVGLR